ncbi:bifunctional 2-aminoadipate transaminase/aromatic-amino-acid:2-oxoglutarate transaminase [Sugiyamaella lignohabitans]|uniref:Bifunctional 2-aminoadipate transaminase/aromatic-amino-acid:2-oxoglutarate transaminase n=1 Tax=Sugiyamaella lignohabitans TaxID=796027 RepID=A0A161HF79_9ASCO|nr:bifunctional 2-aminoadipate transaminase/aromatic-amino-acid:2-oxoglutarate transaminase [Sugiyamaella lignohabitans]ANB11121.1 bifunctional 2-aminoadipate transaminase/aromatic-amino-acid:2-oxoglutarate transaminase [Sugiyamaella lignohabitans]
MVTNNEIGLPHYSYFPYDTLEAAVAQPHRFSGSDKGRAQSSHIVVPKVDSSGVNASPLDIATVLQYGTAQGIPVLYEWLKEFTTKNLHPNIPYDGGADIILSCGNTDGMHKTLATLANDWSPARNDVSEREGLLVEKFCYMSAVDSAKFKGLNIVPVDIDYQGLLADSLEFVLANWDYSIGKRPHLLYTVSTGQNPTGGVVSVERRKEIYKVCSKYDVVIIEDEPYWFLQYPAADEEDPNPPSTDPGSTDGHAGTKKSSGYEFLDSLVQSYLEIDTDGRVVRLDTFSKNVAPGCRLGWITAQPAVIERITRMTEGSTQQPSGFVQSMIAKLVGAGAPNSSAVSETGPGSFVSTLARSKREPVPEAASWSFDGWVQWLSGLRDQYQRRMVVMCQALDDAKISVDEMSDEQGWTSVSNLENVYYDFDWPRAGMFVWLKVHLDKHPLASNSYSNEELSTALWVWMTRAPNLVLVSPGRMFSPAESLIEDASLYFRLCFAAIAEDELKASSQRIASAIHSFWSVDEDTVEELIDSTRDIESNDLNFDPTSFKSVFGC